MALGQAISRRSLANYAADQILAGNSAEVLDQIAGYLVQTRKTKDYELIIGDIERQLAGKGSVLVRVKSARPLSKQSSDKIKKFMTEKTNAEHIELVSQIDEDLIGGAIISANDFVLDASLRNRLNKLKGINKE